MDNSAAGGAAADGSAGLQELYHRFRQQADWTAQLRANLLARIHWQPPDRILEVGCGPGAVTSTLHGYAQNVFGIDIHLPSLALANTIDPATRFCAADALDLPYAGGSFSAVVCHFFLLWAADQHRALAEMSRVTRPGGAVIAFAEPDYGARIDYPPALEPLGSTQAQALRRQGAETNTGRTLSALFHASGLARIETGLLGGQWSGSPDPATLAEEWRVFERDFRGAVPEAQIEEWREQDAAAWRQGTRVLFVPTFYAIGWKS